MAGTSEIPVAVISDCTEPLLSHFRTIQFPVGRSSTRGGQSKMPTSSQALRIMNVGMLLASIGLLIYSASYVRRTGPSTYYSHFNTLYLSACLNLQALQTARMMFFRNMLAKPWCHRFLYLYLVVLALSGFIGGVAFSFSPKPDTTAVAFLVFFDGFIGIAYFKLTSMKKDSGLLPPTSNTRQSSIAFTSKASGAIRASRGEAVDSRPKRVHSRSEKYVSCIQILNRILMTVHSLLAILSLPGAIELAMAYRYTNPLPSGTRILLTLDNGDTHYVNYNCTTIQTSGPNQPTIWLEADAAHGIVDFLGMQTYLAQDHGRNSCSYDPPNFGWSDRLPSSVDNFFDYFNPLLDALGREQEDTVIAGWGAGAENALMHTIRNNNTTKALVLLDASPDGIEWMDAQRKNNWTDSQMLAYRSSDLASRVALSETILGLGIPWGLMSVLNPGNSTGYFDQSLYSRYRAQGLKEDMWAYQYYSLLQEEAASIDKYRVTATVPKGISVYAIMTYDAGTDAASSAFYRTSKLAMADHIAGGNLTKPVVWCEDTDCSLSFPVNKPRWAAQALINLGV